MFADKTKWFQNNGIPMAHTAAKSRKSEKDFLLFLCPKSGMEGHEMRYALTMEDLLISHDKAIRKNKLVLL